ncbi:ribosome small subunit-dependent GTPase A [Gudongella sp. SC589]|jgi:ribosome biogenesis GTPase|uniref:ribosome small subunit-dependent GTPase A n=1 Tax=Gudongella sp. SC589 TaxID=3385990 RepID=UPI00390481C0
MNEGTIIKGIGGFYYVQTETEVVQCRARGIFRETNITPLVGDRVRIRISEEDGNGYIEEIFERESVLLRPPVANVTQAVVVSSIKNPELNTWLLDRMLVMAEEQELEVLVCINKCELDRDGAKQMESIYTGAGYNTVLTSVKEQEGLAKLKNFMEDHISVFAGPSGVGKSSLLNSINSNYDLEIGKISLKTSRGKHTTRHVELLKLNNNAYVLDSPGFSSLNLDFIEDETQLRFYFKDIEKYNDQCKFSSCIHVNEPGCAVKDAVESNIISRERYKNYLMMIEEIKNRKRRY